jgi:adenylate kinase family enzyme
LFGLPFSGKDTVGKRLAEDLGGKFLSSGTMLRAYEQDHPSDSLTRHGRLSPKSEFRRIVLPYLAVPALDGYPLILDAVGRWEGEEMDVINALEEKHPLKAVILLNVSENEAKERWETAKTTGDRDERPDDAKPEVLEVRFEEFREKTLPVLKFYKDMKVALVVNGRQSREAVYAEAVEKLSEFAEQQFLGERLQDIDELMPEEALVEAPAKPAAKEEPKPEA